MKKKIPFLNLSDEITSIRKEIDQAISKVIDHGQFVMGPEVRNFESNVDNYLGTKYAVSVNSGTDALMIALRSSGVSAGDEVITTPFTFFATAEAISNIGAKPVFADISLQDFNIDPVSIEKIITSKTKAILPVHLFGMPCKMSRIKNLAEKNHLKIIEDCAQSFGASYQNELSNQKTGNLGDASAFSFFPSKNLGGFGDGGLIATNDKEIAEMAAILRTHGAKQKYHNEILGYNSRLDTMQAAILNVKLQYIDQQNSKRREAATRYNKLLNHIDWIQTPEIGNAHVFHQYTLRILSDNRDEIQKKMEMRGVQTMIYYPIPCHKLPVYKYMNIDLPNAELASSQVLSLPIWPDITQEVQEKVIDALLTNLK